MLTMVKFDELLALITVNCKIIRAIDLGSPDPKEANPCSITFTDGRVFACAVNEEKQKDLIRFINMMSGAPNWQDTTSLYIKSNTSKLNVTLPPQTKLVANNVEVKIPAHVHKEDVAFRLRNESANTKAPDAEYRELLNFAKMFDVINATGMNTNKTALHWAAKMKNIEKVKLLLEAGAKKDAIDINQKTPFALAKDANASDELLSLITVNGIKQSPEPDKSMTMKP